MFTVTFSRFDRKREGLDVKFNGDQVAAQDRVTQRFPDLPVREAALESYKMSSRRDEDARLAKALDELRKNIDLLEKERQLLTAFYWSLGIDVRASGTKGKRGIETRKSLRLRLSEWLGRFETLRIRLQTSSAAVHKRVSSLRKLWTSE